MISVFFLEKQKTRNFKIMIPEESLSASVNPQTHLSWFILFHKAFFRQFLFALVWTKNKNVCVLFVTFNFYSLSFVVVFVVVVCVHFSRKIQFENLCHSNNCWFRFVLCMTKYKMHKRPTTASVRRPMIWRSRLYC